MKPSAASSSLRIVPAAWNLADSSATHSLKMRSGPVVSSILGARGTCLKLPGREPEPEKISQKLYSHGGRMRHAFSSHVVLPFSSHVLLSLRLSSRRHGGEVQPLTRHPARGVSAILPDEGSQDRASP